MQINPKNKFFVTGFNLQGGHSISAGFPDEAQAKDYAATFVAGQKGGHAVVFEAKHVCKLPTPAVEWQKPDEVK